MKKYYLFLLVSLLICGKLFGQTTPSDITVQQMATFNAYFDPTLPDTIKKKLPYYGDLGVRRVIVADPDKDGQQEVIATDYTNGGRVHVMRPVPGKANALEIVWSSPVTSGSSGSTPRFPQVGDCDGDGNPEIIFPQGSSKTIQFFEWDPALQTWGTEPAFVIDNTMFRAAGALQDLRLTREVLTVEDFDGDGRTELILHSNSPGRDVWVIGVENDFPGFAATISIEGGHPSQTQNAMSWATGSFWNSVPADIDGDGKLEIVNHHWDQLGFWAIDVTGPNTYVYPDTNNVNKDKIYHRYMTDDGVSYMGASAVDVNGDGRDEIVTSSYTNIAATNFDIHMLAFNDEDKDKSVYLFGGDTASVRKRHATIATKTELAGLGGKKTAEFWPVVKGDLNQDGKDEIYTGGGRGVNLIAIQYKGTGSVLDPNSYVKNLVYKGEGADVFATYKIYHGKIDTVITGTDTVITVTDPTVLDTVREETPFTAYIYANNVDLDRDKKLEIVLAEQSVYDSITVQHYKWVDSTRQWALDKSLSGKIINNARKTVRVLEYDGLSGFRDEVYAIIDPDDYKLEQNYPNPFNPTTSIRFSLPVDKKISLKIYDMLGKEVATLINNEVYQKGSHEMKWNGKTNYGTSAASGNYIARITYGNFTKSIKMTLLK